MKKEHEDWLKEQVTDWMAGNKNDRFRISLDLGRYVKKHGLDFETTRGRMQQMLDARIRKYKEKHQTDRWEN